MNLRQKTALLCSVCCIFLCGCFSHSAPSEEEAAPSEAVPAAQITIELSSSPPASPPDPESIEDTAKDKLGLVYPGEIIFRNEDK